jgi:hypothetical protein
MDKFCTTVRVTSTVWLRHNKLQPCLAKGNLVSRRSLPIFLALGTSITMVASANADIEGKDTSKGGEAPGADLRSVLFLSFFLSRQLTVDAVCIIV